MYSRTEALAAWLPRADGRPVAGRHARIGDRPGRNTRIETTPVTRKDKDKKNKKDAQLVLRLNKDLRDEFVDACKDLDTSAAREIRRFIKRFLRRYQNGDLED